MEPDYDILIGLEIHSELKTQSKMFCACRNPSLDLGLKPNSTICPICVGHPGTLPALNLKAVEWTILAGLALGCGIARQSKFDRKHYFYPDLPKNFQISQYDMPLAFGGHLDILGKDVDIIRIHVEEDTGKLIHENGASLVDYNRSGVPLMELVTAPEIHSGREARLFAENYRHILRALGVSDADMEKGQMRVEANVSLQKHGTWKMGDDYRILPVGRTKLNSKVEIKNLNSFKSVELAINYEIKRQLSFLEGNKEVERETRGWDEDSLATKPQRVKEEAQDYRYFPEPDIPPLAFSDEYINELKGKLPELPAARKERFMGEYALKEDAARMLVSDLRLADEFEKVMSELYEISDFSSQENEAEYKTKLAKLASNWILNNLSGLLLKHGKSWDECKITGEDFAEFINLIASGRMSTTAAKSVLEKMVETGGDPHYILEDSGFRQELDLDLEDLAQKVIDSHPKEVQQYKKGKGNIMQFFVGRMMKETKGRADPEEIAELLRQKLLD